MVETLRRLLYFLASHSFCRLDQGLRRGRDQTHFPLEDRGVAILVCKRGSSEFVAFDLVVKYLGGKEEPRKGIPVSPAKRFVSQKAVSHATARQGCADVVRNAYAPPCPNKLGESLDAQPLPKSHVHLETRRDVPKL